MSARLRIRESTYRHQAGHAISGTDTRGRRVSVWVETRAEAEAVVVNLKAGREPFQAGE